MAIPSVWISDGNTKLQTCHFRGGALQELTKITQYSVTRRNENCVRCNERIASRCSRPGQMSPEFSSNFHKVPRALVFRVPGYFNQSRAKYLLSPAMVITTKRTLLCWKRPWHLDAIPPTLLNVCYDVCLNLALWDFLSRCEFHVWMQLTRRVSWENTLCYRGKALSATTLWRVREQQRHNKGPMTPSAALREEPGSGSLARGRPQYIPRGLAQ